MLNNKGMTLVEIIITFALVMAVVVGLYNLILEVKFQMDERQTAKDVNAYSSTVNHSVHYSMLKAEPDMLFLKTARKADWVKITPNPATEEEEVEETLDSSDRITIGDLSSDPTTLEQDYCHRIYPCLLYVSADKKTIGTIALFNREAIGLPGYLQGRDYGILYGEKTINGENMSSNVIFDPLPDSNKVEPLKFTTSPTSKGDQTYITYNKDDKMIEINYPLYIVDNPKNYGFRIAYSFMR